MSAFVLDASVAAAWMFEDEANEATDALLNALQDEGAHVPALWHLELSNLLLSAERRGRITAAQIARRFELIACLSIKTDVVGYQHAFEGLLNLARTHALTIYDATYLELAMRLGVPIATKDKALRTAAKNAGVKVLP